LPSGNQHVPVSRSRGLCDDLRCRG
jgi:hypothetical protein